MSQTKSTTPGGSAVAFIVYFTPVVVKWASDKVSFMLSTCCEPSSHLIGDNHYGRSPRAIRELISSMTGIRSADESMIKCGP
jgi:hypothetical protein